MQSHGTPDTCDPTRVATPTEPFDFDRVYHEHGPAVFRFLRSMRVRDSELDDVFQEVFLVVHRRLPEFDGRHRLTTWLYAICLRVASGYRRRAWFRRERPSDFPQESTSDADASLVAARAEALPVAWHCLEVLDNDKRAVFVLFEIEELAMSEIAIVLGCPLQTAYSRLYAARDEVQFALRRIAREGTKP
jgi:RNA polymerase sigma-70 factor, ECF subfamily